jgi:integrase
LAKLHRELPLDSLTLDTAVVREVERVENDVSVSEAARVDCSLRNFCRYAGDIQLEKIDEQLIESCQRKRLKEVALTTVNREINYIIRLLRLNGLSIKKPGPKRGRRTKHRPFSNDELKQFFSHCNHEHYILFIVMLTTGARPAELIPSLRSCHKALLKEEIDPEKCEIIIRTAKLRPNQEEHARRVKIPQELLTPLVNHARGVDGPHVFRINQSLCKLFDRILKRAGIPKYNHLGRKLTAHLFRHTYATRMAEAVGNNPFVLKQLLGHTQITTTERYCHADAPDVVIDISELKGVRSGCTVTNLGEIEAL